MDAVPRAAGPAASGAVDRLAGIRATLVGCRALLRWRLFSRRLLTSWVADLNLVTEPAALAAGW